MEYFLFTLRIFLAGVFFLAGIGKLLDLKGAEKAVKDFGVPESLAKPFGILLPVFEVFLAVLLLFVQVSWFGAIGTSLLLTAFIGGMLWQMKLGNAPDCHCFGQIHSEPVGKKSLLRNMAFAIFALILVVSGQEHQGFSMSEFSSGSFEIMQIIFGLIIIGFLCVLMFYLKNILEQQTQILRRLEVLEIIGNEGNVQERENIGNPKEGLPIGSPVTDFELPNLRGRNVSFEHLLMKQKPMLFFYVSPTCTPCEALLPEIKIWERELEDKINFVFISNGSIKENSAKFGADILGDVLLQKNKEIAEILDLKWTPTAVFVNTDGMIASHPAAGDKAIRELVGNIKSSEFDEEFVYIAQENQIGEKPKIGENVPEFNLEDLTGKQISAEDLHGKKTLVTFWSMTCPHCVAMSDELSRWDKIKGKDEPNLIVFSDGDKENHKKLDLHSPIILDKQYETAAKFGMLGTPSAVLVNEDGKIISETAIGAGQIWALIGKRNKSF